jgi:ATP/maltotriose-dependent transcriptional regulator MalT
MVELARTLGDRELCLAGHHTSFVVLLELGEMGIAAGEARRLELLAEQQRSPYYQWHGMVYRAMRASLDGRFEISHQLALQARVLGRRADAPNAAQVYELQHAFLCRQQGQQADAIATVEDLATRFPSLSIWRCLLATLACETGDHDHARSLLDQLAHNCFACLTRDVFWMSSMALLSTTCARLGDVNRAGTLYQLLSPYAALNVMAGRAVSLGAVSHYLGLLAAVRADWTVATDHFEHALAAHERMAAPPLIAQTQHEYAVALIEQGRREGGRLPARDRARHVQNARGMLEAAHIVASDIGLCDLVTAIDVLLRQATVPASHTSFPGGLTTREVTVLRLLASGQSNPEIAADLNLSVKTIERHTVNIYAKIGARNRVDAAAFALRHDIP